MARRVRSEACTVLLVAPLPPPMGGIARWTGQVLKALRGERRVRIIHVDVSPRWRSIHATGFATRLVGGSLQGIRDSVIAAWLLLRHRPAVIHLCTTGGLALMRDLTILGLARLAGARVAYHIRMGRVVAALAGRTPEGRVLKRTARLADVVLALDAATEAAINVECNVRKVERIPNFIDLEFNGGPVDGVPVRSDGTVEILYVGWVVPSKGLCELVGAFSTLAPDSATLTLVGPAEEGFKRELQSMARAAGCASAVTITGELSHDEVLRAIAGCDILVLPSYSEGFPNVLLEGMALGRPIVATAVGAIPEILGDGGPSPCGILVPPADRMRLAEALERLVRDPSLRGAFGAAGAAGVRARYSAAAVVPRYVDLWCRLAAAGRTRRAGQETQGLRNHVQ